MSQIEIRKVTDKKGLKDFINFHHDLYRGDPYDAPTLFVDDWNTLNKQRNAAFEFCDAEYYLAYRDGRVAGRVAAIINHRANVKWERKSVRFGWIDFIDDREVSAALLQAVEDYGRANGMTEIVGPLGFTDMDPEGMLTWGFDQLGTMATIYNYPYYPEHIESLEGYEKDNGYVEYKMYVPEDVPEKYTRIASMIEKRYNLHVRKFSRRDIYKGGYGQKVFELINDTFKDLYGYSEMTERQIRQYVDMYMPLIDLNLVTGVEDWNNGRRLVGVGISMPSLSMALQKCRRGRLMPFGWWHLLRALKLRKTKIVDLMLLGILPEYRSKGANALMFADLIPRFQQYGFEWGESQVELESNEGVQSQWQYLKPVLHKRRKCYRKSLSS